MLHRSVPLGARVQRFAFLRVLLPDLGNDTPWYNYNYTVISPKRTAFMNDKITIKAIIENKSKINMKITGTVSMK